MTPKSGIIFTYTVEPFLQNYLSHANSPSAFPTLAARRIGDAPNPLAVLFYWANPLYDDEFVAAVAATVNRLSVVAQSEGLLTHPPALYGNYAGNKTPLVEIYGDNLPSLRALKAKVDPKGVMGLAGGFKF